jgi:hypothetical protein
MSTGLEDWLSKLELPQHELLAAREIEGHYFGVYRAQTQFVVASRKIVEREAVGSHRVDFEVEASDGHELSWTDPCAIRPVKADFEPCDEGYCDVNLTAYELPRDYTGELTFRLRWDWITADVDSVDEMREFTIKYLEGNQLPVILEGRVTW